MENHVPGGSEDFSWKIKADVQFVDLLLLGSVPVVLCLVFFLPEGQRSQLVFEVDNPSILTAFTASYVHLTESHLTGNVAVYLVVAPMYYLVCVLSDRRPLFWYTTVVVLSVFPFALATMQLSFLTKRTVLGFSGINAAFAGLLCFAVVRYTGDVLSKRLSHHYSPVLLFVVFGIVTLVSLPDRAWRTELAILSFTLAGLYLGFLLRQSGIPTIGDVREALDSPGYVELAGSSLGIVLVYPFVAFQPKMAVEGGALDIYIHLLGFALGFIVVYIFVTVTEE
ncbi:hypothetical protein ACFQJ7_05370 [Halovenus rubra]|uniref:Uncharacterized protein n=2 Tax=Halovenus rubra TaxID=869890 RepID=A0ACC7DZ25_9EURY|nr:hypothetical protein [Halovenus rubra]